MAGLNCISFLMTASKISYSSWHGDGLFNLRDQELCIISQASDIPREVGGGAWAGGGGTVQREGWRYGGVSQNGSHDPGSSGLLFLRLYNNCHFATETACWIKISP